MRNLMRNLLSGGDSASKIPQRAAAAAVIARAISALPPHQRHGLSSSSEELTLIYWSRSRGQVVEELEEEFYEEEFDPVRHFLEHILYEEIEVAYFEEKAALRLAQLDKISERLSCHDMENHEEMVKGMHLVRELEKDLKVANVICMNGRRHLNWSRNEVSRDLIVTTNSRRKQALLDMLPVLAELRHALDMQVALEVHVEEGNFCKAFQVLSEYLQVLDSFSELSAIQEMSHGVEVKSVSNYITGLAGKTLQKLDSFLLGVCQDFKEESYITVDSVPYLTEHIHRKTARLLLHINGYVDLLLGEFKHYKNRLAHGGIQKEVQDLLLEYGLENLAEILIEGLSRVKRCADEGRALMSLDLQVLINGLHHFVSINVIPKLQVVKAFVKAYYLPETEYVHWVRAHPEYSKSQMVGLVNLVATMKGWKRKNRLDVIEKIESVSL